MSAPRRRSRRAFVRSWSPTDCSACQPRIPLSGHPYGHPRRQILDGIGHHDRIVAVSKTATPGSIPGSPAWLVPRNRRWKRRSRAIQAIRRRVTEPKRTSAERSADQDLLRAGDVRERAVEAEVVVGDAEAAHVGGGHRARAGAQGDRADRPEVERYPESAAVREGHVLDRDREGAEAAAAAELR